MISSLWHLVFFAPLYNALVWLSAVLPGHNLGLAVISLTIIVKAILLPLQRQMIRSQMAMKALEPKLAELKTRYANNQTEQARQVMQLYKEHHINPFSSFLVLLIQLPILFALYYVFRGSFQQFDPQWLYHFVTAPQIVGHQFLGLDLTTKSYLLAILTGLTQFWQVKLMTNGLAKTTSVASAEPNLQQQLAKSMQWQMRYFLPVMIAVIAAQLPAAMPLYWVTSNLFIVGQEWWFRRSRPAL